MAENLLGSKKIMGNDSSSINKLLSTWVSLLAPLQYLNQLLGTTNTIIQLKVKKESRSISLYVAGWLRRRHALSQR
jgi:hypothetical protein